MFTRTVASPIVQGITGFTAGLAILCYGTYLAKPPAHLNINRWQQHAPVGALALMAAGFVVSAVASSRAHSQLEDSVDRSLMPMILAAVTIVCALIVWA